jgi:hypothetical protein
MNDWYGKLEMMREGLLSFRVLLNALIKDIFMKCPRRPL